MTFFDLPHIFVVFPPGTAGNFICVLLGKLNQNDFSSINTTVTGSAHLNLYNKRNGIDYLSFGTEMNDHFLFPDTDNRLNYYLNGIRQNYNVESGRCITWTHDFSNIPLYKKYFPNSKILVITHTTLEEKLIASTMNVIKNFMVPEVDSPLSDKRYKMLEYFFINESLKEIHQDNRISADNKKIIQKGIAYNRFDAGWKDIATYYFTAVNIRSYRMQNLLKGLNQGDVCNNMLFNSKSYNRDIDGEFRLPEVGPAFSDFYDNDLTFLSFDDIIFDGPKNFINIIQNLVSNGDQSDFILNNLLAYRSNQNTALINNPCEFYANLSKSIDKYL